MILERHSVYKAVNKPLMILGAERRMFFVAALLGAATFNLLGSLLGGLLLFGTFLLLARWATRYDEKMLRIIMNSSRFKRHYDPWKSDRAI